MYKVSELEQFADRVVEFSSRYNSRNHISYGPGNLRGKYSKYPAYGDFPETYTLRSYGRWWRVTETNYQKSYMVNDADPLEAEDFVTVHFNQAVLPTKIYVYETYNPGAIVRIWGKKSREKWTLLWEGEPQTCAAEARKFQPQLRKVSCFVDTIRLELNCVRLDHHTCLDAVLLCGYPAPDSNFQLRCLEAFGYPKNVRILDNAKAESCSDSNYFDKLPFEITMKIFRYLDLESLSKCACVCKDWNEITKDSWLYQNLSLKKYWYTVDGKTLDFFRKRCKNLRKLDLSWCGNDDPSFARKFYQFFTETCENLTHLSLGNASYFNGSHLAALSRSLQLTELRLRNVYISDIKFCHVETLSKLTKLQTLDLYSTNITDRWLLPLLKSNPNLKFINLDFCDDIENFDVIVAAVAEFNKNLEGWSSWKARTLTYRGVTFFGHCRNLIDLDLGWSLHVLPPNQALEKIAAGCAKLKRLILAGWRPLVDSSLFPIVEHCKDLEQLDLLSIKGISQDFVEKMLEALPKLRLLELSFCDSIPIEKIEEWRGAFPKVKIQRCIDTD